MPAQLFGFPLLQPAGVNDPAPLPEAHAAQWVERTKEASVRAERKRAPFTVCLVRRRQQTKAPRGAGRTPTPPAGSEVAQILPVVALHHQAMSGAGGVEV